MREVPSLAIALSIKISPIIKPRQPERSKAAVVIGVGFCQTRLNAIVKIKAKRATSALKVLTQKGETLRANSVKIVLAYEKQSVPVSA